MPTETLADDEARRIAVAVHDRTLLVEAGAGSGKTAILSGRVALLLAAGVDPASIAAVTFTELAASELLFRIRETVAALAAGHVPVELRISLPDGLSDVQREQLQAAEARIDEITCTTIHGFCQRLIKPYPVEADLDPGASVMDRDQADQLFRETQDGWLREALDGDASDVLAELVLKDPGAALGVLNPMLAALRRRRVLQVDAPDTIAPLAEAFRSASNELTAFIAGAGVDEDESADIARLFSELAESDVVASAENGPAQLVQLLATRPNVDLCTKDGSFRSYRKKGKWAAAAGRSGYSKADGERLNISAERLYTACCVSWTALRAAVSARVLADLLTLFEPVLERFRAAKRSAALLDFDDLLFGARDLLRGHHDVRQALARRYTHVLVDEFQDTDALQTEILWRLCGDPPQADDAPWTDWRLRPGALFLVGDPKQAIYRFRGADVAAYLRARAALEAQDAEAVLSVSTNFRSCQPILEYVNERFGPMLTTERGQPGYTPLDHFHPAPDDGLCVAALDVAVAGTDGKASSEQQRDAEADRVAELCAGLIGHAVFIDRRSGERRVCRPGDIALLAPTGAELWRYEEALEARGVPVATQAGKGLFRRQEIQDLVATTRVLADRRDTLALGALLRGPIVGLTEEELLDIVWGLPRNPEAPDDLPRLDLSVDAEHVEHPYARELIERLQALCRRANATAPYDLLSQAVDVLRVRPLLRQRCGSQAERALANVDLYLSLSRAYAVRGLRAFAETMTAAWSDRASAVEGRPDAQEDAVALYTMHAAKGLEWPIVVPVNAMTKVMAPDAAVLDRETGRFLHPVLGVAPTGYDDAREAERSELERERVRLWYVAATRARELLVLPRLDVDPASSAWISLVELSLHDLPAIEPPEIVDTEAASVSNAANTQTREVFASEAARVAAGRKLVWRAPSRGEASEAMAGSSAAEPGLFVDADGPVVPDLSITIQGGRERGIILHKLLEEVLTGETDETAAALRERAGELIQTLGRPIEVDPAQGLSALEMASCVERTLALPEIVALRPRLEAEFPVYALCEEDGVEVVTAGVADAIARDDDGLIEFVIDWKSDVAPSVETLAHYKEQVSAYLAAASAQHGLIVFATTGRVLLVAPRPVT